MAKNKIGHPRGKIVGDEVERDALVVPEQFTILNIEAVDGKGEELLDGSFFRGTRNFRLGLIGSAVRINNDVDDRMIEEHGVESELGFE